MKVNFRGGKLQDELQEEAERRSPPPRSFARKVEIAFALPPKVFQWVALPHSESAAPVWTNLQNKLDKSVLHEAGA
jgi:hypothetical protein